MVFESSKFSTKILVSLLLIVSATFHVKANYFFQHYTISHGLPNNSINALFKDRYGFLWIGTNNGLSQYDGYSFRNFLQNPSDSFSLPNNNVTSITEDKSGLLWIGMWGGVATFNPKTQKFKKVNLWFEQNYDKVVHIFCDSKNRIWVSTTVGNYLFKTDGTLIKHWNQGKGPHDLPHHDVVFTQEDKVGNIWVSGRCGLCRFREETMDYEVIPDNHPPYLKGNDWLNSVNEGSVGSDGTLWYGSWANGLRRIDPKTKNYTTWLSKPEFAGHGAYNVISGTAEFDGKIWIASHDQGLGYLDLEKNQLFFLRQLNLPGYDLPSNFAGRLLADGDVLWIGTRQGLYKYDQRLQLFEVFHFPNLKVGSCLPEIQTVAHYKKQDLLFGTWTCGLYQYDASSSAVAPRTDALVDPLIAHTILDIKHIEKENDSTFWYATSHGLYVESGKKRTFIKPGGQIKDLVSENYFNKILKSSDGTLWAGSGHGILKIDPRTRQYKILLLEHLAPDFKNKTSDNIVDISEAPNGDIWFLRRMGGNLFQLGFTILRKKTGQFVTYVAGIGKLKNYPFPQTAFGIKATTDGHIFVVGERGLTRFNGTNPQKFDHFASFEGLLADRNWDLEEDNNGNLWVLSTEGLSCFDLASSKIKTYTTADGLPDAGLVSLAKMPDGNIAIGLNSSWFSILKPDRIRLKNEANSLFRFTGIEVENHYLWPTDSLQLSPDVNLAKFTFSPLDFFVSAENEYEITIDREGQRTRYQTPSNQILLSDLRPGWYHIKVSAPNLKVIDISFYKKPWFWQTTWFLVLCLVLAFGGITLILLFRQRKILAQREQERSIQFQISEMQMTALRSQIDAHFIFNALNAINNFIWQKLPEQASDYLSQFARLMRINLENTRTDWVPLGDELDAVTYYFNLEALALEPMPEMQIILPEETTNWQTHKIPPMLLQPLVENVFKHGFQGITHKGLLKVELEIGPELLIFKASDNGKGLEMAKQKGGKHVSLASRIMNDRLNLLNKKLGTHAGFTLERVVLQEMEYTVATLSIPYQKLE